MKDWSDDPFDLSLELKVNEAQRDLHKAYTCLDPKVTLLHPFRGAGARQAAEQAQSVCSSLRSGLGSPASHCGPDFEIPPPPNPTAGARRNSVTAEDEGEDMFAAPPPLPSAIANHPRAQGPSTSAASSTAVVRPARVAAAAPASSRPHTPDTPVTRANPAAPAAARPARVTPPKQKKVYGNGFTIETVEDDE